MSGPIYGGNTSLNDSSAERKGLYGTHPAFTPKYDASNHIQSTLNTQARMYIPVPSAAVHDRIIRALPQRARPYAEAFVQKGPDVAGRVYVDFVLQNASEPLSEKVQVSEVLSDAYVAYYFGQRAPNWSYSGVVLNTQQDQWYDAWHIIYNDILRGTRLAELGVPVVLSYDTRRVIGSLSAQSTTFQAQNETFASLQFQMLVREAQYAPDIQEVPTNVEVPARQVQIPDETGQTGFVSTLLNSIGRARHGGFLASKYFNPAADFTQEALSNDIRPGADSAEVQDKTGVEQESKPLESIQTFEPDATIQGEMWE